LEVVVVLYGAIRYQSMKKAAINISQHNSSPGQTSKPSAPFDVVARLPATKVSFKTREAMFE